MKTCSGKFRRKLTNCLWRGVKNLSPSQIALLWFIQKLSWWNHCESFPVHSCPMLQARIVRLMVSWTNVPNSQTNSQKWILSTQAIQWKLAPCYSLTTMIWTCRLLSGMNRKNSNLKDSSPTADSWNRIILFHLESAEGHAWDTKWFNFCRSASSETWWKNLPSLHQTTRKLKCL